MNRLGWSPGSVCQPRGGLTCHAAAAQDQVYRVGCELVRRSALVLVLPPPDSDDEDAGAACGAAGARGRRDPSPIRNLDHRHRQRELPSSLASLARSAHELAPGSGPVSRRRREAAHPRDARINYSPHVPNRWQLAGDARPARAMPGASAAPSREVPSGGPGSSADALGQNGGGAAARRASEADAALWPDPWGLRISVVPHHALRD